MGQNEKQPPPVLGRVPDPAKEPRAPKRPLLRVSGRGILISYSGAAGAPPQMQRSKEDARALAGALSIVARSKDTNFAELASAWSEDEPSRAAGAFVGTFRLAKDNDSVARTLLQLDMDCVAGPVDAPRGFYLLQRIPVDEVSYQGIIVTWGGVEGMPLVLRSKEEARARAGELLKKARENPAAFDAMVAAESDDLNAKEKLGKFGPVPRGDLKDPLEGELLKCEPGAFAGPIETPVGFVVFRRLPVEYITFNSLLIAHRDVAGAPLTLVRSREDAKKIAEALVLQLKKPNCSFEKLVADYGDDEADKLRKGRRSIGVSDASAAHVRAIAKTPIGETLLLETPAGFFVMQRLPPERD